MHHHHPPNGNPVAPSTAASGHAHQRRRKKRPNYGTRIVEVRRGYNGFGFTISGQQPCRLSCIVPNSPAEQAGLRPGDFLISVNGLNVSKLSHDTVVQLIGNSFGSIRMQIAENYFSDSSDEENAALMLQQQQQHQQHHHPQESDGNMTPFAGNMSCSMGGARAKPRFMHHKTKMHRMRNSPQKKRIPMPQPQTQAPSLLPLVSSDSNRSELKTLNSHFDVLPLNVKSNSPARQGAAAVSGTSKPAVAVSPNVANVSAMVRVPTAALEYRAIVGYLGTIEMPKQISHSSKLQTVRSCIRKLRQEKRQPTVVLMTIWPDCLRLQATNGNVLASYASERLNYVSSSSESENRFFGLVTSAVHTLQVDEEEHVGQESDIDEKDDYPATASTAANRGHISISNSCHVFVIDTKLSDHQSHVARANEFRIQCTRDPISSLCLEFPNNSEYVVNLIRSMYTMRILPPATRHAVEDNGVGAHGGAGGGVGPAAAHSPQPSNHSEISTTTSNSDSGIGFHNDCANMCDRIVVVDFPGGPEIRLRPAFPRPMGIFNSVDVATDKRLTVRAMPDPKTPPFLAQARPNLLANFQSIKSPATSLTVTRSCDDVLSLVDRNPAEISQMQMMAHASMDDISLHSTTNAHEGSPEFLHPSSVMTNASQGLKLPVKAETYSLLLDCRSGAHRGRQSMGPTPSKLSPKVFGMELPARNRRTLNFEALDATTTPAGRKPAPSPLSPDLNTWSSLLALPTSTLATDDQAKGSPGNALDGAISEPDLGNRSHPKSSLSSSTSTCNASPLRRDWGQFSFRSPRTDKHHNKSPGSNSLIRRSVSMTASDNDVYVKSSMGPHSYIDELKQAQRHKKSIGVAATNVVACVKASLPQIKMDVTPSAQAKGVASNGPQGVAAWGTSFELLLEDPAGLHTFAEFLKKEFSAENIYFWTACERFRHTDDDSERAEQAANIYGKHLANGSCEAVNVDSQARNLSAEKLQTAERSIFAPAQKQIFNLMKFDSYQRFIRSDLYKRCLEAEEKHQPLPFSGDDLDELLKIDLHKAGAGTASGSASSKLKKSASNAEDRRRKSLLPWHRKTRSKSRDRIDGDKATGKSASKLPQLSGNSLKIPSAANSVSDVHSSRSSLSSFDTLPGGGGTLVSNGQVETVISCSLCRVILSDGATTIVQTRAGESVGQLVERLLEKRGLTYQFYDVVLNGTTKSIDLRSPSEMLAGKEVQIERRACFKLILPDPKVISVKSKPKKQLYEVMRPILHKYNYDIGAVRVVYRDTRATVDLSLAVSAVEGEQLEIISIKELSGVDYHNVVGEGKFLRPALPRSLSASGVTNVPAICNGSAQSTLDEITNKVFSELMQGKVESQANAEKHKASDLGSLKSEDCASEASSSIFDRMRKRDSSAGLKPKSKKKSTGSQQSEETAQLTGAADAKKPIIAKLKAGVKLQLPERVAENHDELLDGLKRAQLARLEDQRGTEINFELPDFLKNKENINAAASKLRKLRANLSPVNKASAPAPEETPQSPSERPQPAPRLSITNKQRPPTVAPSSPMKVDDDDEAALNSVNSSADMDNATTDSKAPPPLPPKPKVLPIKPSNWGFPAVSSRTSTESSAVVTKTELIRKTPLTATTETQPGRCAYLEEPSSSFV